MKQMRQELKIKILALADIKPYENNPRRNDNAVDAVANSIREFGFNVPIIIDSGNVIVAGHTRYKAAQKLGLESVPCIVTDDLTPEQVKAFRLADNRVGELSGWNYYLRDKELDELIACGYDMERFGFIPPQEIELNPEVPNIERGNKQDGHTVTCPKCGRSFEK